MPCSPCTRVWGDSATDGMKHQRLSTLSPELGCELFCALVPPRRVNNLFLRCSARRDNCSELCGDSAGLSGSPITCPANHDVSSTHTACQMAKNRPLSQMSLRTVSVCAVRKHAAIHWNAASSRFLPQNERQSPASTRLGWGCSRSHLHEPGIPRLLRHVQC